MKPSINPLYFISAQPDAYYFIWQLEILIFNLKKLGVEKERLHILFGYDPNKQISKDLELFIKDNGKYASIYAYPDTRKTRKYVSSLRPHIIAKHLTNFPHLQESALLYHDSDLLFRELPDEQSLLNNPTWYVADTKSYLGYNYLLNHIEEPLLEKMCAIIGIDVKVVRDNDRGAVGGAQYVVKNTSSQFWEKIEKDCENIFSLLEKQKKKKKQEYYDLTNDHISKHSEIQSWCTDMWVMLWNAWLLRKDVQVHEDLNFCWPYDPISEWNRKKILHYSGGGKGEKYFKKGTYHSHSPFYDIELKKIDKNSCSFPLLLTINDYKKSVLSMNRVSLLDFTFIFILNDNSDRHNLELIMTWLTKQFEVEMLVIDVGVKPKLKKRDLPSGSDYLFIQSISNIASKEELPACISRINTPYVGCFMNDTIIPPNQILEAIDMLKMKGSMKKVFYPYSDLILNVDNLFKTVFSNMMNAEIFLQNIGKFNEINENSPIGDVFFTTNTYLNEVITDINPFLTKDKMDDPKGPLLASENINGACFRLSKTCI